MKFTAAVEGFIKFISNSLDNDTPEAINNWVTSNLLSQKQNPKITNNIKAAFFEAQKILCTEYIMCTDLTKVKLLLNTINTLDNEKLKIFEYKVLADAAFDKKGLLALNTQLKRDMVQILNEQFENIKDDNLKQSIADKVQLVGNIIKELEEDNNVPQSTAVISSKLSLIKQKHDIHSFIENLFKINMSHDVLVDVVINDNLSDNKTLIVGRPKVLGSASKQMRHISPYSFLEYAIKSTIMVSSKDDEGYKKYIQNLYEAVKPLIQSKEGICLNPQQYGKLLSEIGMEDDGVPKSFQLKTHTVNKQKNEYHLISNEEVISKFQEINKDNQSIIDNAHKSFKDKFAKYIDYGIKYLTDNLDSQNNSSITMTCEAFARIMLTMFNQDKYVAFPDEGNSIKEEMRVYKDANTAKDKKTLKLKVQDQKEKGYCKVWHHDEFVRDIDDTNSSSNLANYDLRIRFVDNEGITVQNVSKALTILNDLLGYKSSSHEDLDSDTFKTIQKQQTEYNTKYNINVKEAFGVNNLDYDNAIDYKTNLQTNFHYHVAKHLYLVFDYKPLENKVLVSGASNTIKVYPSATGERVASYSIQDGTTYRDLQVNAAKGYNDNAIFRANMSGSEIKYSLVKACVKHIKISLIPFDSLKKGCNPNVLDEGQSILEQFVKLVQEDYNNVKSKDCNDLEVNLDQQWMQDVTNQYTTHINDTLNLSGVSIPIEDNYDV